MRIAYIVLAHRLIDQLARLVRVLADAEDTFFIHLDERSDRQVGHNVWLQLVSLAGGVADLRPLKRHRCYWGNLGLVQATLEGIRAVVESGEPYDRVLLISGQDYPIKPLSHIKRYLSEHPQQEFIESFSFAEPNRWTNFGEPYSDRSRAWYWHLHVRGRWLHLPLRRQFPLDMVPHGGSQWWGLTRPCVEYIHRFVGEHPQFLEYYRHAFIPDEQFFQTILANSAFAPHLAGHDLTYVDSSRPEPPWPATLTREDLAALRESPKLFARKFDHRVDGQVLDLLDEQIADEERLERPSWLTGVAQVAHP